MSTEIDGPQPAMASAVEPRQPRIVDFDAPCRHCRENLRGQLYLGDCPRCGTSVVLSATGLRNADPRWVAKLSTGLSVLTWGRILYVVWLLFGVRIIWSLLSIELLSLIPAAVAWLGMWLITERDPGAGENEPLTARKITRILLAFVVVRRLVDIFVPGSQLTPEQISILKWTQMASALAYAISLFTLFMLIEKIADRLPDDRLQLVARWLRWMWAIGSVIYLMLDIGHKSIEPTTNAATLLHGAVGFLRVIFSLMTLAVEAIWLWFFLTLRAAIDARTLPTGSAVAAE